MITTNDDKQTKTRMVIFDSVAEAMSCQVSPKNKDYSKRSLYLDGGKAKSHWYGFDCYDGKQAEKIITGGFPEGVELAGKLQSQITLPPAQTIKRRTVRRSAGDNLNIHKVNSGQLSTAWESRRRVRGIGQKTVILSVNVGSNCHTSADDMAWRGATCIKLCEILTAAGYAVKIVGNIQVSRVFKNISIKNLEVLFTVKEFSAPLNKNTVASSIVFPGFFRYGLFKVMMAQGYKCVSGLGHTHDKAVPQSFKDKTGVIAGFDVCTDKPSSEYFITNQLTQLTEDSKAA